MCVFFFVVFRFARGWAALFSLLWGLMLFVLCIVYC